jgi:hypothetical protein
MPVRIANFPKAVSGAFGKRNCLSGRSPHKQRSLHKKSRTQGKDATPSTAARPISLEDGDRTVNRAS